MVDLETQLNGLIAYMPHFHITIIGPWAISSRPKSERIRLEVDYVVAASLEDAVGDVIEAHIKPFCEARGYPFEAAEWAVLEVQRCNCN